MTGGRKQRLLRLLEIISTRPIHTQEELVQALADEGYQVTQSSVSRDISALGLIKLDGVYHRAPPAEPRPADPNELRIREGVLASEPAGEVLVVIHTPPGEANRVGVAIDRLAWPEVVGTIAGDDTIFLAARDRRGQRAALARLRELVGRPA
jgi:transcriptional regulator of arginine metabolism